MHSLATVLCLTVVVFSGNSEAQSDVRGKLVNGTGVMNFVVRMKNIAEDKPNNSEACENGWAWNNQSCFKFVEKLPEKVTVEEAREHCISLGGHLASIHSAEENAFVATLAQPTTCYVVFIGLSMNADNQPEWHDGSPVDYTSFANNAGPTSAGSIYATHPDCSNKAYVGVWKHRIEKKQASFVCRKKAKF